MMDETTDVSNTEQVVIVFRCMSHLLEVHEEFLGVYQVASIKAEVLASTAMDCLKRFNISVANFAGNVTTTLAPCVKKSQVSQKEFKTKNHEQFLLCLIAMATPLVWPCVMYSSIRMWDMSYVNKRSTMAADF